ncbi:polysaccharide deacetylase family protein [Humitalea sp. 24SJ18S-53]|uniref:polysaccharide deacetylase family protein n=1 Tax=Humitalea sp. 24SJ18S-53 TaxID=3422307 RepID=UPI003D67236A
MAPPPRHQGVAHHGEMGGTARFVGVKALEAGTLAMNWLSRPRFKRPSPAPRARHRAMETSIQMRQRDTGLYDFLPYNDRPMIAWPGGARIAVWVVPNIEFYEFDPPRGAIRQPWPRPSPDVLNYAMRDYGNRVGLGRMMEAMQRFGIRGSVSLSVAVCDHFPDIIRDCRALGWEFLSHGIYNTRYLYGMSPEQERQIIHDTRDSIEQHTGQRLDGWLSPALSNTEHTIELLAEEGIRYTMDFFHDDQPTPLKTRSGRLMSLPYSWEINDAPSFKSWNMTPADYGDMVKRQFDQLYAEGAESGTVMGWPLHPFNLGQPHRIAMFNEVLAHITSHDGVWLATGREIADWYDTHCYDAFRGHAVV